MAATRPAYGTVAAIPLSSEFGQMTAEMFRCFENSQTCSSRRLKGLARYSKSMDGVETVQMFHIAKRCPGAPSKTSRRPSAPRQIRLLSKDQQEKLCLCIRFIETQVTMS